MRHIKIIVFFVLVILSFSIAACSIKPAKYGQQISNRQITVIKDILANPKAYEGKIITIDGKIANECSTGFWFFVKVADADLSIYVDTGNSGFAIPQKSGKNILVEGTVVIKKSGTIIQARGVEIR